jgi:predicted nucleic-acid-binding protein
VIYLDTNVLVRLLTGDNARQQAIAKAYIAKHCSGDSPAYISRIVAVETVWVLERAYGYAREQIAEVVDRLLHAVDIVYEEREAVRVALKDYRNGAGFADALIAQTCADGEASTVITFDESAAKRLSKFRLLM